MNPKNPLGTLGSSSFECLLYQLAAERMITTNITLLNNSPNAFFVIEKSQGRISAPEASFSTTFPLYSPD